MAQTLQYRFRLRRRDAASWSALNEVLLDSEIGLERDTRKIKIGDGVTPWNALAYFSAGSSVAPGYISGLQLQWASDTALTVSSGSAYIEGSGKVLHATSAIAKTGLALTASTWYYVYLYDNAGTPGVELSTTVPASPYNGTARSKTADASRRFLGAVLTNSSGSLISFSHAVEQGRIDYRVNATVVLSNGRATSATPVSLAGITPVSATHAVAFLFNNTGSGSTVMFAASDGPTVPSQFEGFVAEGSNLSVAMRMDSSRAITYAYQGTPPGSAGFTVRICGYLFGR